MSTLIALVMTMHRTLLRSRHSTLRRTRETVEPAEETRSPPLERARDVTAIRIHLYSSLVHGPHSAARTSMAARISAADGAGKLTQRYPQA